eukprot:Skav233440  [mRNA]  locus=scaffold1486:323086:325375:- [translate_table: standard]
MDTVAFTFRESSENQVQYLDEAKGEPVKFTGEKLDSASLEEWVNGLVYAPWCGFSRKVLPVWKSFAQTVSQVKHLVVAKMDGDQNTSPLQEDFSWTSYPHIFFVKAGTKKPIVFHGNRTVSHFVQFAEEHGSKPLDLDPSISLDDINEL